MGEGSRERAELGWNLQLERFQVRVSGIRRERTVFGMNSEVK